MGSELSSLKPRILVCAPSNAAIDELLERIYGTTPHSVFWVPERVTRGETLADVLRDGRGQATRSRLAAAARGPIVGAVRIGRGTGLSRVDVGASGLASGPPAGISSAGIDRGGRFIREVALERRAKSAAVS